MAACNDDGSLGSTNFSGSWIVHWDLGLRNNSLCEYPTEEVLELGLALLMGLNS
jgi:hypothetical protein